LRRSPLSQGAQARSVHPAVHVLKVSGGVKVSHQPRDGRIIPLSIVHRSAVRIYDMAW